MSTQRPRASRPLPYGPLWLSGFAFIVAVAAVIFQHLVILRHPDATGRLAYSLAHVDRAAIEALLFTFAVSAVMLSRSWWLEHIERSKMFCVLLLVVVFCVFWLPVLLSARFVQDDWILLAAATARKSLALHPHLAWWALDTVDSNFRPLTTVLYPGVMLRLAGMNPVVFGLANFFMVLLSCVVAFRLVREFGYSNTTATGAAILFLSRGLLYTQVAWMSDLGDAVALLFCGLAVLLTVIALRSLPFRAGCLHVLAWSCCWVAVLSKQSAFVLPAILACLFLLRPVRWSRRLLGAGLATAAYGAVVLVAFKHAQHLQHGTTPYPLGITAESVLRVFFHVACYLFTPPVESQRAATLTHVVALATLSVGLLLVVGGVALLWRRPRWLGSAPQHVLFALCAGFISLSLFIFVPTRGEAYYAAMSAFWFSLALAMMMVNAAAEDAGKPAARWACWIFVALLVSGYADVRFEQAGLAASGSYIWGNYSRSRDQHMQEALQGLARSHPAARTVVIVDTPLGWSFDESAALIAMPQVTRLLVYRTESRSFFTNDRNGYRPDDGWAAYTDRRQYAWNEPFLVESRVDLSGPDTLWIDALHDAFTEMPAAALASSEPKAVSNTSRTPLKNIRLNDSRLHSRGSNTPIL